MHTLLPETKEDLVAVRVREKVDRADIDSVGNLLESVIKEHGKARLFWEMIDFKGWTPSGALADTDFDLKHAKDFSRVAMVGDKKWQDWMTSLMKPFTSAEVRFFEPAERDMALAWAAGAN